MQIVTAGRICSLFALGAALFITVVSIAMLLDPTGAPQLSPLLIGAICVEVALIVVVVFIRQRASSHSTD